VRKARGVGARNLAAVRRFIEIGGLERIRLNPGLIDKRKTARRAGSKYEFGTADHLPGAPMDALEENYKGAEPNGIGPYSQSERARRRHSFPPVGRPKRSRMRAVSWSRTSR